LPTSESGRTLSFGVPAAMTVHVSNPAFVHDLLASLKRANYTVSQTGEMTVEVYAPSATTAEQARLHLGFYLANWRARHPGIVADIVR
jgi:hypothetical protein